MTSQVASITAAKAVLRKKVTDTLNSLKVEDIMQQSKIITQKLFSSPEWSKAKRISFYLSMPMEAQTDEAVLRALGEGKVCYVPLCAGGRMRMLRLRDVQDLQNLPKNSWGIREPKPVEGRDDAILTGGVDLVVCPGVAFTMQGHRLGHGKAYYDRFLKELKALPTMNGDSAPATLAFALKEQIFEDIPVTDTDVTIDRVLTPE